MRLVACAAFVVLSLAVVATAAVDPRAPRQQHTAADAKRAKAIVLRLGDLAAGWKLDPPAQPNPPCSARPDESNLVQTAKLDPSFTWKDGVTNVGSEVDVFRTVADARADWRASTRAALATCLLRSARAGLGKAGRVTIVSAQTLAAPKGVERSVHYRFVFALRMPQTTTLVIDLVAIGRGRVNAVLHSLTVRAPLPGSVVRALTGVLAARLNAGRGIIA
jgi:hypothetical protein